MPQPITLLDRQIDEAQHDIDSIEKYINSQNSASISSKEIRLLRQLQAMYRDRIIFYKMDAYRLGFLAQEFLAKRYGSRETETQTSVAK